MALDQNLKVTVAPEALNSSSGNKMLAKLWLVSSVLSHLCPSF